MTAEFSQVLDWSELCSAELRLAPTHPEVCCFPFRRLHQDLQPQECYYSHPKAPSAAQCDSPAVEASVCVCPGRGLSQLPADLARGPHLALYQVLSHPGHSPVTSMAWSPNGSLLVSASPRDTAMLVWDVDVESCVPLYRVGGGGVTYLSWSPDGSRMLAATPSSLFSVWETRMWTCERWPCLKGRCQSGSWSPDGSRLLSVQGETVIYTLTFTDTPGMSGGPKAATVVADLSETTLNTPDGDMAVGGEIQSLAWDLTGERLAVLLKGDAEAGRPAMIAVFKTQINPAFKLLPCGFVQGKAWTEPRLMQFNPNYQHGAQLTVCWSNGKITHVPFCFECWVSPARPGRQPLSPPVPG